MTVYDASSNTAYVVDLPQDKTAAGNGAKHEAAFGRRDRELPHRPRPELDASRAPTRRTPAGSASYTVKVSPKHDGGLLGSRGARLGRVARRAAEDRGLCAGRVVAGARARGDRHLVRRRAGLRRAGWRRPRARRSSTSRHRRRPRRTATTTSRRLPSPGSTRSRKRRRSRSSRRTRSSASRAMTCGSSEARTSSRVYGAGLGGIVLVERPGDSGEAVGAARQLPTVSLDGVTAHELATQLGTVLDLAIAPASSYVLAGSLPPAAAEAAARVAEVTDAPPVAARGLVKRYGEIVAVDGVDLTVERGDVFGYLGPNGAGKTTSLRMLLGLIRPDRGERAAVRPRPAQVGARALDGVAGFVEGPRFYPYLSGRRNLRAARRSRRRRAVVAHRGGARAGRAARPREGSRRRLLARHAPAARHRGVAAARPAAAPARRADDRSRSRRGCATCASSSSGSPARGSRSCSRAICSPRSRSSATASRSSAAGRSSTRACSTTLLQSAAGGYRLRASDPERARAVLLARGVTGVSLVDGELRFQADGAGGRGR